MHYYSVQSDQLLSAEFLNTTLASNEFCFTNESLPPNMNEDALQYTTQSPKSTKRGFLFNHEVSIENMEKSPEFNRFVDDTQKSDSKFKKAQSRLEGPACDLPLSTKFDESNRKQRFTPGKGNKGCDSSMKEFNGKLAINSSCHYQSNSTESSFHSANLYKKTPEGRRGQKYASLQSTVRSSGDNSLANNLRKEVEVLRENLKMKDKQLKESLSQIEFLQKDLKRDSNNINLIESYHVNQTNESREPSHEGHREIVADSKQRIESLRSQNDELKEGLRNEIMASERQRTQIDMLKGMLEGRLERLGIFSNSKMKNADMIVEYESMKRTYTENERSIQSLTQNLIDLTSKLQTSEHRLQQTDKSCESLSSENLRLKEDIENGIRVLQQTREELAKVEEERNSLIEYINNELTRQEALKAENQDLKERIVSLEEQNNEAKDKIQSLIKEIDALKRNDTQMRALNKDLLKNSEELKSTVEVITSEKQTLLKANMQHSKDLAAYLSEIQQKNTELQVLRLKFEDNKTRIESEKLKDDKLSHEKNEFLEKRLLNNESAVSEFRVKIKELEGERYSLKNKLQIFEVQKTALESQLQRTERFLDEANKSLEQKETFLIEEQAKYRAILKERDHQIQDLGTANIQIKEEITQREEKCALLEHETEILNTELRLKTQEVKNVRLELENCKSELKNTKSANEMLLRNTDSGEKALVKLQVELNRTVEELHRVQNQSEGADDYNMALKKRVESLETELLNKRCILEERTLNIMQLTNERDGKGKTAVNLAKDLEDVSQELTNLTQELEESKAELKRARQELAAANEVAKTSLESLHSFVEEMTRSYAVGLELQDSCGEKLKDMMNLGAVKIQQKQSDASLARKCAHVKEWLLTLLDEVELAAQKRVQHMQEYKQLFKDCKDLKEKLQRKSELEREFEEKEKDLRVEMHAIREEKMNAQRELVASSHRDEVREDEIQKLKKEIKRLETTINSNCGVQLSLKQELKELELVIDQKNSAIQAKDQQIKELEERIETTNKDNSHLTSILEIVKDGVFSEEFLKLLQSYQEITTEVEGLEREREIIEGSLNEKEVFLKAGLKNGTLLGAEIIVRRKEVDKLRGNLQNTDTQLSKNSFDCLEATIYNIITNIELKDRQQLEKRKQQESFDNERKLKELKSENQDLQFQYELMTETANQLKDKLRVMTGDRSLTLNNQDRSTIKLTKRSSIPSLNKTNDKIAVSEQKLRLGNNSLSQGIYLEHNHSDSFSIGVNNPHQTNNDSLIYDQNKENKTPTQRHHKRSQSVPRNSLNSLDKTGKFVIQQTAEKIDSKKQEIIYGAQNAANYSAGSNGSQISLRDKLSQARSALHDVVTTKGIKPTNGYY